jgi:hypothetical protein
MIKRLFSILLIGFLINSCTTKTEETSSVTLSGISGQIGIDSLFSEFEYIVLETSNKSIFGKINKLIVYDKQFFILDKTGMKKIYVFSEEGTFSHTIGNVGGGQGEYMNIEDFVIDEPKRQVVVLAYPSTIYIYDMDGRFVRRKRLSETSMLWNIVSYSDGFVCSTNHQSATSGEDAFLIYMYDKEFNPKGKALDVLPIQVAIPPFIARPVQKNNDEIVYFDNFTSTVYFNVTETDAIRSIRFIMDKPAAPEIYADPQRFFTRQGDYCFFLNALIANNVLWSSFANKGKECVCIMNLATGEKMIARMKSWYPAILDYHDNYFYACINPLWILEGHNMFSAKTATKYPVDVDVNPVLLRFKANENLPFLSR